ncbi:YhbD family protein [Paenibacillus sediminis]|uniref:DNA-binding transcriptional MerR regulator n=1 Tax=Paenibacillus sediminis TaxID=664909 RepID=A0ABS4H285_9BACL|nr:DNA-binding transcriptional MerR regulator [Paenibacillus sediminis]
MSDELISKKELLELTGISYGQLYRWKRKNLIPEEWFVRKSSFTGQETFFPKEKMLTRIDKILNMKDDLSLDELADVFSPNPGEITLQRQSILERNIVSKLTFELYMQHHEPSDWFSFDQILCMYVLETMLKNGSITQVEGEILIQTMEDHYGAFAGTDCELALIRKMGVPMFALLPASCEVHFDRDVKWVSRISLSQCIQELKLKIGESEG